MNRKISIIYCLLVFIFFVSCSAVKVEIAEDYWYKAKSLEQQGRYLEAAKMFEKSAEIEETSGESRLTDLSAALNSAAFMYYEVGQYDKALKYYQKSLVIEKKLGREFEVGKKYNNIGLIYGDWGLYEKAIEYHKKGLAISKSLGRTTSVAVEYNNIGINYQSLNQYDLALEYLKKSLEINKTFGIKDQISTQLNNIGLLYSDIGQYKQALQYYKDALKISQKYKLDDSIATQLGNIGCIYLYWGDYEKALDYLEKSLTINRNRGKEADIALNLSNIGTTYESLGHYDRAIEHYEEAIALTEKLRLTAKGDIRRDYFASQIITYQHLTSTYLKNNDIPNAFRTIEISRAKLLAERIVGSEEDVTVPAADLLRKNLQNNEAVLVYANADFSDMVEIVLTQSNIFGMEVHSEYFITNVKKDFEQPIQNMLNNQRGIKLTKKEKNTLDLQKTAANVTESNDLEDVINFYRSLLSTPCTYNELRQLKTISRLLYQFLIKPVEHQLNGKDTLTIIPDGILNFIPFETLIDEDGRYLIEKFEIKYIQSMGVKNSIQTRNYNKRKPMLAFGGAVYNDVSYDVDMIDSQNKLALLEKQVFSDVASRGSVRHAYAALGTVEWKNLPGTLNEVKAIGKINQDAKIVTGEMASEHYIKSLSKQGELAQYQVLHFATHGLVVPAIPEMSALVLSQFNEERKGEDGYLLMGEISNLNLEADFVNLSACETGLGKIYGGEGVVGLTQSFLIAGANSLSVSLWQVADESTSQFMVAMYNQVEKQKTSFSQSITNIKRRFINGDFGEEYRKPYYWAPFVYYGK